MANKQKHNNPTLCQLIEKPTDQRVPSSNPVDDLLDILQNESQQDKHTTNEDSINEINEQEDYCDDIIPVENANETPADEIVRNTIFFNDTI